MGKKHFSDDTPGSRGRTGSRPSGPSRGSDNSRNFSSPRRSEGGAGNERRFGGSTAPRGGDFSSRPAFGRPPQGGQGSYGGPKKFGSAGSYGDKKFAPKRDFDRDAPRRSYDDRRESNSGYRDERPVKPFEPKGTWAGQPYRHEDKPAVPRGDRGERNRKFNKVGPNPAPAAAPQKAFDNDEYRAPEPGADLGPDREIRPARPFDFRGRPDEGTFERERPRSAPDRREGGAGPRSSGERPAFGSRPSFDRKDSGSRPYGNRNESNSRPAYGDRPQARPYGDKREARPYGEGGKDRTYGDKRDARPYGERSERPYEKRDARPAGADKRTDRDAPSNRAGKLKYGEVAGVAPEYKNLKFYEEDKNRGNKRRREEEETNSDEIRLNRYIANAGICSRREADSLIVAGEIKVNGEVITELGYKVKPTDTVQYGKTNLNREKLVYVLLNKPKDFITTTEDPEGRRTVMELVASASKERIFPVGRLDRNTTGLLLFTNDGEVAQKLSHPSHKNKKIYQVELDKPLTEEHLKQITAGLELEDGKAEVDDVAVVAGNPHFVGVEIHIGRNRIVRRIFEHLGYDVVTLDRVQYAGLTKKDLPRGKWRFLSEKEVIRLKYFM
jgi:23S rRNA pseudouridine2605 synthase